MEQARVLKLEKPDDGRGAQPGDATRENFVELEKVIRRSLGSADPGKDPSAERDDPKRRDLATALAVVQRAATTMRATEERSHQREVHAEALAQRAHQELKAAEARVQAAEARVRAADARVEAAEARSKEMEDYFRRLCDAVKAEFSGDATQH